MSRQELKHPRKQLERKLQDLTAAHVRRTDLLIVSSTDPVDRAQSETSMDLAVRAINDDWQTTKAIGSALGRIETDEHGMCEACGEPIAPKRLRAIPWATLCTPCQSSQEAAEEPARILQEVA